MRAGGPCVSERSREVTRDSAAGLTKLNEEPDTCVQTQTSAASVKDNG